MRGSNTYYEDEEKAGYGVWLILIVLFVGSGSFSSIRALIEDYNEIDIFTLSYYLIMLVIGLSAVICFFLRLRVTPKLIIAFLTVGVLYSCVMGFIVWKYGTGGTDYFRVIRFLVQSFLIIPYLLISKRVKEIFVN